MEQLALDAEIDSALRELGVMDHVIQDSKTATPTDGPAKRSRGPVRSTLLACLRARRWGDCLPLAPALVTGPPLASPTEHCEGEREVRDGR